jgi:uncharacterized membrane protein
MKKISHVIWLLFLAGNCFSQALQVTLTPSNYNGFNISCFGGQDGNITVNVSGGVPPYTYVWTTAGTSAASINLRAGYYAVRVTDSDSIQTTIQAEITLTEPEQLRVKLIPSIYPNDYNISCYNCYNGYITSDVSGGVEP